jgi:predicted dehydrogenase
MVHENFRWQAAIRRAKAEMAAIGRPFWGRVSFRSGFDVYAAQPYLATDARFIIEDLGIHILDVARFLFGEVVTLAATTQRVNQGIRGEDVATMLLAHASGVTSVVDCSYASRLARENFPETLLEIEGEAGSLRLDAGYRLSVHAGGGTRVIDASPPMLSWAERPWHNIQESVLAIERHFADCLREGREPETSGADNLGTLALVHAAYESAGNGGRTIAMREYAE